MAQGRRLASPVSLPPYRPSCALLTLLRAFCALERRLSSRHPESEVTFDELWNTLAVDHYEKESQYAPFPGMYLYTSCRETQLYDRYVVALKRVERLVETPVGEGALDLCIRLGSTSDYLALL